MRSLAQQTQFVTVRFEGHPTDERLRELDAVLGGGYQLHDSSTPLSPGTVIVTVGADTIIEAAWLPTLIDTCSDAGQTVGVGLLEADGTIHHAGAVTGSSDHSSQGDAPVEPFGAGCDPSDRPLFSTDRYNVALLAPYAQWVETPGAGAAALANRPTGRFLARHYARRSIESTTPNSTNTAPSSAVIDIAVAVPSSILVGGSSGDEAQDVELLLTIAADSHVIWHRPSAGRSPATSVSDGAAADLAQHGVFEFDADDYPIDGLAAAFGVDQVLHLDDEILNDGNQVQQLLRARPNAHWAVLANRCRPGLEQRCEMVLEPDTVDSWAQAGPEHRDHKPSIRKIETKQTSPGVTSIVIPVYGMWALTEQCLAALDRNTTSDLEIIIVDDASPDDTSQNLAALDDERISVVTNPSNLGFPASVNNGIQASTGEFVCVLNNDTEVTAGWLDELLDALAIEQTLMVGPRSNEVSGIQRLPGAPSLADIEAAHIWAAQTSANRTGTSWRTNRLVGFCLLAKRSTFVEHGGFDDGFGQGNFEDDELSARLRSAGGDLRVADRAVVLHHGSATFASLATDYLTTLASAARHHRGAASEPNTQLSCLVLSNGDHVATEQTVWSLLGLGHHFRVVERTGAHTLALRLARAQRLGVEVIGADWTTPEGASAALIGLDTSDAVMVFSAGEIVEVTDWGAARAEIEQHIGSACGIVVDGQPQVRAHPPTETFMETIGEPTDLVLTNIKIQTTAPSTVAVMPSDQSEQAEQAEQAEPPVSESSVSASSVSLLAIVLSDGDVDALESTVESALSIADAVIVLDRSGSFAGSGEESDPIVNLDWSDESKLSDFLDDTDADQMLILATGERLVVDPAGWAADLVLAGTRRIGVVVGDDIEIRITNCSASAVGDIGTARTNQDHTALGLRIIAAGFPHSDVTSLRFPELSSPAAMAAAHEGVPAMAERLAESLVIDEDLRMLDQIRAERPIKWHVPLADVRVGVVVVHDPLGAEAIGRLDDTLNSLLDQGHPPEEIVVVSPPGLELTFSAPKVRHIEHCGLAANTNRQSRQAHLANLGSLLVEGDWIALIDAGDIARSDHLSHMLAVAFEDQSEYVHGLTADAGAATTATVAVSRCDERQAELGTLGPLLFASEYRALQLRPTSVLLPENPSVNRTERLRVLGAIESAADEITMARPVTALSAGGTVVNLASQDAPPSTGRKVQTGLALHLGCGPNLLEDWTNIDLEAKYSPDIVHDLSHGLPFENNSVDLVYSEHFFEHLALADGVALMAECHRVLRPGGRVRIAMPDLASTVRAYLNGWRDQVWVKDYPRLDSAAHMMNMGMRSWGHQFVYDIDDLTMRLRSVGFDNVTPAKWGHSDVAELVGLETRADSLLVVEATA